VGKSTDWNALASSLSRIYRSLVTRRIYFGIVILLTGALLGYLIYHQWNVLINYPWQFRPWPAIGAFLLFSLDLTWVALIWGLIMNAVAPRRQLLTHLRYYIISNVAKRLPGTVWYVTGRMQLYTREGIDLRLVTVASGIELIVMILGAIITVLIFAIPILLERGLNPWVLAFLLVCGLALLHPRLITQLFRLMKIEKVQISYIHILTWTLAYIPAWILSGIILYLIGSTVTDIPVDKIGAIIGYWTFTGLLSVTVFFLPSNFGLTEITLTLLLSRLVPPSVAAVIAILTRLGLSMFELIWAGIFLLNRSDIVSKQN
jgi:hypothetical protein